MGIDNDKDFREAIGRMTFSFNGEMDSPKRKSYARILEGIPVPFIELALDRLINENAGGRQFYPMPTPADLKAACAKVIAEARQSAFVAALGPGKCEHCHGTRWKSIDVEGSERLTRCDCWTGALKAMNAVAQPLALPPAPEIWDDGYDGKMRAIGSGDE